MLVFGLGESWNVGMILITLLTPINQNWADFKSDMSFSRCHCPVPVVGSANPVGGWGRGGEDDWEVLYLPRRTIAITDPN